MSFSLQAVLFDLDGVLVHSPLDLDAIKRELFGDASVFIIEGLEAFPEKEKLEKQEILHMRELEAAANASLDPGVDELFKWINDRGLEKGIITRNTCDVVNLIKKKFQIDFGAVVAREDAPPKPDPESVYTACRMLNDPILMEDIRNELLKIKNTLGGPGASRKVAATALDMLS